MSKFTSTIWPPEVFPPADETVKGTYPVVPAAKFPPMITPPAQETVGGTYKIATPAPAPPLQTPAPLATTKSLVATAVPNTTTYVSPITTQVAINKLFSIVDENLLSVTNPLQLPQP